MLELRSLRYQPATAADPVLRDINLCLPIGQAALVSLLPPGVPCDPSLRGAAARLGAAEAQQACGWPRE